MLRSMQELKNYTIGATDGEIGHITDFFFDDDSWVIRYLVVETGSWLLTRKVLISPYSLMQPDWMHKRLPVRINREQVKNSPDIDTERPVSRQHEIVYADYYSYPHYWAGTSVWADALYSPTHLAGGGGLSAVELATSAEAAHGNDDPHLRSCTALDGDIGHVQGMLVDEDTWALRYLVVDTANWWGGHQVLISPDWIESISWADSAVFINLNRDSIKASPGFDSTAELNHQHELALFQHYQRSAYWDQEPSKKMTKSHDLLRE